LKIFQSEPAPGRQASVPPSFPQNLLFKYRSEARKYQFKTEILKD